MSSETDFLDSGFYEGVLQELELLIAYMERGNEVTIENLRKALHSSIRIAFDRKYTTYQDYLQSEDWAKKSLDAKERAGWRCQLCNKRGDKGSLHTHHKTYDRIGRENNDDLIVLCAKCHAKFHGKD